MTRTDSYDCSFLTDILPPEKVNHDRAHRDQYSQDASPHDPSLPDAVVSPTTTTEVAAVLAQANARNIPVTPWSGGSGLEGNAIPIAGGIVLSTYDMTGIDVHPADLQVTVKPGVIYDDLNDTLAQHGLRFPPGISSGDIATIGGMIATNASGFNSVRYGETRDHVLQLEVVLPDGRIITCGRKVIKTSAGYSLKDLFIGSEGTLGVITEATLLLTGLPAEKHAAIVAFPTPTAASEAVSEIIRYGLQPGAIEFINELAIELINDYSNTALDIAPTLILEFHSNNSGITEDVAFARDICDDHDAISWEAAGEDNMERIWRARRDAYDATRAYRSDWDVAVVGDVVVPISRYPDIVDLVESESTNLDLLCPSIGHAGDGNLHYTPLVNPTDPDMVARATELNERIVTGALELGGTATGEHGIGHGKQQFMEQEHGEALNVMRALKDLLDPHGIMNPGKVLPEPTTPTPEN